MREAIKRALNELELEDFMLIISVAFLVASFAFAIASIWLLSWQLAGTAALLFALCFIFAFFAVFMDDY